MLKVRTIFVYDTLEDFAKAQKVNLQIIKILEENQCKYLNEIKSVEYDRLRRNKVE